MFKEKIKPSLVLTLICIITCGLLVMAYEATYVDDTGVITDKLAAGLTEIYGASEGFEMLKNEDGSVKNYDGVTSVIEDSNGSTAFEITTDGYSSGGLHVLVGIDSTGAVKGVSVISIGETPGLGTKVQDASFRDQFKGLTFDKLPKETVSDETAAKPVAVFAQSKEEIRNHTVITQTGSGDTFALDAVTGATFSSKGMNRAVTLALNTYNTMKGDAVNE